MPKVSIIIPLYKVERYVSRCVDSVLGQSLTDIEVILVDDGSPDRCGQIADDYARRDPRVKVIHKDNGGLSSARNAGLDQATGEFVGFVDADDWVEPEMFAILYERAVRYAADVSVCNYNRVYDSYTDSGYLSLKDEIVDLGEVGLERYLCDYFLPYVIGDEVCNKIYRMSVIRETSMRFDNNAEVFSEDKLFNLRFLLYAKRVCCTSRSFYNYSQRAGSLMNSPRPRLIMQYVTLIERFIEYAKRANRSDEINRVLPVLFCSLLLGGVVTNLRSGMSMKEIQGAIESAMRMPGYRGLMLRLLVGRSVDAYCRRMRWTFARSLAMRGFALLCFLGLYWFAVMVVQLMLLAKPLVARRRLLQHGLL